jgi:hypothetical protein
MARPFIRLLTIILLVNAYSTGSGAQQAPASNLPLITLTEVPRTASGRPPPVTKEQKRQGIARVINVTGDIASLQTLIRDVAPFRLDIVGRVLTVRPQPAQQQSGRISWRGAVSAALQGDDGHALFSVEGALLSAEITAGGRGFRLVAVDDRTMRLTEINLSALPNEADPVRDGPDREPPQSAPKAEGQTIDVLLLYTKAVLDVIKTEGLSIEQFVGKRQDRLDEAYLNGQNKLGVNVRIVHHAEYTGTLSNAPGTQLAAVAADKDVAKLRDDVKADLVALVVTFMTKACGIGRFYSGSATSAFSVTQYNCEFKYTLAHEIGHNLGADHAREDYKNPPKERCNFGFKSPAAPARTLMAYECTKVKCDRKPFFSDVTQKVGTVTMGVACDGRAAAQNVVAVRLRVPVVAKFR